MEVDPEKKKMELVKIKIDTAPEMKNLLMGLTDYSLQKKGDNGKHPGTQAEEIEKCTRTQDQKVKTTAEWDHLTGSQKREEQHTQRVRGRKGH